MRGVSGVEDSFDSGDDGAGRSVGTEPGRLESLRATVHVGRTHSLKRSSAGASKSLKQLGGGCPWRTAAQGQPSGAGGSTWPKGDLFEGAAPAALVSSAV